MTTTTTKATDVTDHHAEADAPGANTIIDFKKLSARVPVAERTLRGWIRDEKLPSIRINGSRRRLFHWPSVEAALLRHQTGGVE